MKLMQQTHDRQGRPVRQIIEAKQEAEETLSLFVYDEIRGDSMNWWTGEMEESETSAAHFKELLDEHPNAKQINVFVNSQGGSVLEAMGIRAHLLRHPAHKTAYVDGWAASAASFLLTGCDEVVMLTGSMQMLHAMWMLIAGNAKELRKAADDLDRIMAGNKEMYLEKAAGKMSREQLDEIMDAETWLTSSECVELGLADRVMAADEYRSIKQQITELKHGDAAQIEVKQTISADAIVLSNVDFNPEMVIQDKEDSTPETPAEYIPPEDDPEDERQQKAGVHFLAALIAAERTKNEISGH